jgi:pimeloyl-ACP methyl ester carboxylesterase
MHEPVQMPLPDGRRIDVRVSGDPDGMPLVFHHGSPAAGTPIGALERGALSRGLRLVTISRPGYGDSTPQPGRAVVDVVDDVAAVLRNLGAERCLVAGWSGGGPHALACAARLHEAAAVLVIAGAAPFEAEGLDWWAGLGQDNVEEFGAAVDGEGSLQAILDVAGPILKNLTAEEIFDSMNSLLPPVDKAVLTDEFGDDMGASFHEAVRVSTDGWLHDDLAFVQPWGFELDEITCPVQIWQGSEDLMVPFAHGQWLADHVPGASVHLEQGQGHFSIALGELDRMLSDLVAAGRLR